ncbi:MAG: PaaI family thioesterase, partial [Candidatus Limnocylindrales bacterium]
DTPMLAALPEEHRQALGAGIPFPSRLGRPEEYGRLAVSIVELAVEPRFQGWDGIAHGGVLCTILDEVMAWALVGEDNWGLTARMSVAFKRPVEVGQAIRAEGWVVRSRRRLVDAAGHIVDARDGRVLATSTGVYVAADETRKQELRRAYGWVQRTDTPVTVDGAS